MFPIQENHHAHEEARQYGSAGLGAVPGHHDLRQFGRNLCLDRARAFNIIDAMRPIALEHGASVARVALAWLIQQPHVTSVIIGAKNREQLVDNIAATELKLSAPELETLAKVSALPPEYPGWMSAFQGRDRGEALT